MEYAKDEIFSIKYNAKKDKLEYGIGRRILHRIQDNKFLSLLITIGIVFGTVNFILIYYFFFLFSRIKI